jgi:uncharacterized protein YbjT (DUF2867 family)
MRMLIAGATGYVGRHVAATAVRAGHDVVAHVRPESPTGDRDSAQLVGLGARALRTDWTPEAWYRMLEAESPDRLFLLLGTTASRARAANAAGSADASQSAIDQGLTMLAITAARHAAPAAGVVYLSALGASSSGNEYLRVRAHVESALAEGPNPFTVIRPSFITGADRPEARPLERLGALSGDALCAVLRIVGARRRAAKLASITGTALARILVDLAAQPLDGRVHELDDFRR